jgi:DNA modification methylase/superfamily II DNA or RNA helicase
MIYPQFLEQKELLHKRAPLSLDYEPHPCLFPFQAEIIRRAVSIGSSAIFADTGLGKTIMQIEICRLAVVETGKSALIIAPLGVTHQTINEAKKMFDIDIVYVKSDNDIDSQKSIYITNYERLDNFVPDTFGCVALDESSILKSVDGKIKTKLIDDWAIVPYKFAFTATPAPNDVAEMANHAAFLGVMSRNEMLSKFFVNDGTEWRLKKSAHDKFYNWVSSWSISVKKPSDLGDGFDDAKYELPPINYIPVVVNYQHDMSDGKLFQTGLKGVSERARVRQQTRDVKVEAVLDIVKNNPGQFLIWGWFNQECDDIEDGLIGAVQVKGGQATDKKLANFQSFLDGKSHLITKPKIAGFGMNFQHTNNMIFCGISDSWEIFYQCVRRQYRFGVKEPVNVYVVYSSPEVTIYENIIKKGDKASIMSEKLVEKTKQNLLSLDSEKFSYREKSISGSVMGNNYTIFNGDSCEVMDKLDDNSIDFSVYSPPFNDLYTYSATPRDLGNSKNKEDFLTHYEIIVKKLLSKTKTGRVTAVHVADIPAMKVRDGYMGMKDFSGDVIRLYEKCGWIFDGRIPIDKNQQAQSIRTKSRALTMSSMEKDRTWIRPAMPDYILKFRKDGENKVLINDKFNAEFDGSVKASTLSWWYSDGETETKLHHRKNQKNISLVSHRVIDSDFPFEISIICRSGDLEYKAMFKRFGNHYKLISLTGDEQVKFNCDKAIYTELTRDKWIELANPIWPSPLDDRAADTGLTGVWYGISEGDTLQGFRKARGENDEKHVCPLQLGTIERCIKLWSNPGETVFTPFGGVGSEVYQSLKMGRNAIGFELKPSYFDFMVKNLDVLAKESGQIDMFSDMF